MTKAQLKQLIKEVIREQTPRYDYKDYDLSKLKKGTGFSWDPNKKRTFASGTTDAASFMKKIPNVNNVSNDFRIDLFKHIENLYNINAGKKPSRLKFTVDNNLNKNVEGSGDNHKIKFDSPHSIYAIGRYFGYSVRYENGEYKLVYEGKRLTDLKNLIRDSSTFNNKIIPPTFGEDTIPYESSVILKIINRAGEIRSRYALTPDEHKYNIKLHTKTIYDFIQKQYNNKVTEFNTYDIFKNVKVNLDDLDVIRMSYLIGRYFGYAMRFEVNKSVMRFKYEGNRITNISLLEKALNNFMKLVKKKLEDRETEAGPPSSDPSDSEKPSPITET